MRRGVSEGPGKALLRAVTNQPLDGVPRIGADTDTDRIAVRILPRVSSSAPHKGLQIARAEIKGTLTVTDPRTFVTALTQGIGRGRAYSCGLILVR